jgi:Alternative oxidase
MVPVLMGIYLVNPTAMHRFVGYLEETACHTYVNIIDHAETPGTHLYEA